VRVAAYYDGRAKTARAYGVFVEARQGRSQLARRFLSRAKPAFEELVAASAIARELGQRPAGLLRLTVPRAVVPILLEPLIASFCRAYPEVEVEIDASPELADIAAEGFDAGIRLGQFIAADMIAMRLTPPFPFMVVGSPDYLRTRKQLERIDDLRQHACLRQRRSNGSIAPWSFLNGNRTVEVIVAGRFIANDFSTILGAAIEGLGLAQVPEPIARAAVKAGKLVHVLEPFAPMAPGVFLYYPGRRQIMPKLRAFIDHVRGRPDAANKTRLHIDGGPSRPRKRV
jgi:DNA-binding transcriptional LysR family regulator